MYLAKQVAVSTTLLFPEPQQPLHLPAAKCTRELSKNSWLRVYFTNRENEPCQSSSEPHSELRAVQLEQGTWKLQLSALYHNLLETCAFSYVWSTYRI
jgi:hypothetical protein